MKNFSNLIEELKAFESIINENDLLKKILSISKSKFVP
jgi:hypothetical protein